MFITLGLIAQRMKISITKHEVDFSAELLWKLLLTAEPRQVSFPLSILLII